MLLMRVIFANAAVAEVRLLYLLLLQLALVFDLPIMLDFWRLRLKLRGLRQCRYEVDALSFM